PPEQNAHPPSLAEGPSPVSKITPISRSSSAIVKASNNSKTVFGRNAFRTSGRLNAILTTPSDFLNVMSSYSFIVCQLILLIEFIFGKNTMVSLQKQNSVKT